MYKKVLYNIKKMKKCGGEGEGRYLKIEKKKKKKVKKKKLSEQGFEPTTSRLEIH